MEKRRANSTQQNKETGLYTLMFLNELYFTLMQFYINN